MGNIFKRQSGQWGVVREADILLEIAVEGSFSGIAPVGPCFPSSLDWLILFQPGIQ